MVGRRVYYPGRQEAYIPPYVHPGRYTTPIPPMYTLGMYTSHTTLCTPWVYHCICHSGYTSGVHHAGYTSGVLHAGLYLRVCIYQGVASLGVYMPGCASRVCIYTVIPGLGEVYPVIPGWVRYTLV